MPDFHIFNTSGNNPDNQNNSELLNNQKTADSSILSGARDVTDEELKRQNTEDSMNVSELIPQKDDSDFYRIVREHLMRWTEEKERKAKEQEEKKREEESKKEEHSSSKSLGSIGSIIKKVRADLENEKTIQNLIGIMEQIEKGKRLYSIYHNIPKQAKDDFWAKKSSEEFRQKTNEFAKISREEAMKDNKNFIIDDDGTPKILVQPGDTLSGIIRRQTPSISSWDMTKRVYEIAKLNNMKNVNLIRPGEKLKVPKSVLPDVTDTLNNWMREHAKDPKIANPKYLYDNFKSSGPWDYKSKPGYREKDYHYFIYNGEIINYDDIGNIHYGYVLNAVPWSSEDLTYLIAGAYQNYSDIIVGKDLSQKNQSFPIYGDNTDDYYGVYKGTEQYYRDLYANMEDDSVPKTAEELKWRPYTPDEERKRKKALFKTLKEEAAKKGNNDITFDVTSDANNGIISK